jgi:hypothetical protein
VTRWIVAAGLAVSQLAPVGRAADAHHSLYAVYDTGQRITLDGVVAQFHFVNPHPYLLVDVRDATGRTQQWRMEMDNRRELVDVGMTEASFTPGERIVASGSPGRSTQINSLYVWRLDRSADGFRYEQIGSSPRVTRGGR